MLSEFCRIRLGHLCDRDVFPASSAGNVFMTRTIIVDFNNVMKHSTCKMVSHSTSKDVARSALFAAMCLTFAFNIVQHRCHSLHRLEQSDQVFLSAMLSSIFLCDDFCDRIRLPGFKSANLG